MEGVPYPAVLFPRNLVSLLFRRTLGNSSAPSNQHSATTSVHLPAACAQAGCTNLPFVQVVKPHLWICAFALIQSKDKAVIAKQARPLLNYVAMA